MQAEKITPIIQPVRVVRDETDQQASNYIQSRGISKRVYDFYGCYQARRFFSGSGQEETAVAFPIAYKGQERSVKFRSVSGKNFSSVGSPPVFFGLNTVKPDSDEIIISEGEIDAMSWCEAGIENSLSVPAGAGHVPDEKKGYLWLSRDVLERASKVILALDNDEPGQACAEELARRIGKAKCWQVRFPENCKDANEVLMKHGPEKLNEIYKAATPWPVSGLYDTLHYADDVVNLIAKGEDVGFTTGLTNLDKIFRIGVGKLIIVTGIPGSGKSELLDQLLVNTAEREGWRHALCSFENSPPEHVKKIIEKRARSAAHTLLADDVDAALMWVNSHFCFIRFDDGSPCRIEDIIERGRIAVLRYGIRNLVIDPYNYIQRDTTVTETQYISDALTACRQFASASGCNVWFVAHPQKLQRDGGAYPMPGGYDISGSAAWFAKADVGLTVGRGTQPGFSVVACWKQRDKGLGKVGTIALKYDPVTGIFSDGEPGPIEVKIDEDDGGDDAPWFID